MAPAGLFVLLNLAGQREVTGGCSQAPASLAFATSGHMLLF